MFRINGPNILLQMHDEPNLNAKIANKNASVMIITVVKNSSVLLILSCQKQCKKSQWTMRITLVILRQSQL